MPADWYSVERGDVYIAVLNHTSDKDTLQQFAQWLIGRTLRRRAAPGRCW